MTVGSGTEGRDNMWVRATVWQHRVCALVARNDGFRRRIAWGLDERNRHRWFPRVPLNSSLRRPIMLRKALLPCTVALVVAACSDQPLTVEPVAEPATPRA